MNKIVIEVTDWDTLESMIQESPVVVVDFAAPAWCIPCQRLAPHYQAASDKLPDVTFIHVNVDEAVELAEFLGIQSVPTVQIFKDGEFKANMQSRTVMQIVNELSGY